MDAAFEEDQTDGKINAALPGFREDSGKVFIPPTVRHVEKGLRNEPILTRDPLPIEGYHPFLDSGTRLAYGANTPAYRHRRVGVLVRAKLTADRKHPVHISHLRAPPRWYIHFPLDTRLCHLYP